MKKFDQRVRVVSLATLRELCAATRHPTTRAKYAVAEVSRSRVRVAYLGGETQADAIFACYPGETRENPFIVLSPMRVKSNGPDSQVVNLFAPLIDGAEPSRAPAHGTKWGEFNLAARLMFGAGFQVTKGNGEGAAWGMTLPKGRAVYITNNGTIEGNPDAQVWEVAFQDPEGRVISTGEKHMLSVALYHARQIIGG